MTTLKQITHLALVMLFFLLASLIACTTKQKVDLIVHHAIVYTVDSSFATAESFAVKDGKFIAVGTNEEIQNKYEATENIDAKGKAIYPGFIDSHCHFYGYGKGLQEVDLVGTKSFDEVIKRIKNAKGINPNSQDWIIGRGWDQNDWDVKEYPNNIELDILFPTTPVVLKRIDGHAVLANGEALRRAGINEWRKVEGGSIEKSAWPYDDFQKDGRIVLKLGYTLSGILIDNAVELVEKVIPKSSTEEIKNSLLAAQKNCVAVGLTTVDDAGLEKNIIDNMDALQKSGILKMRIYAMLTDNKENLDHYIKAGPYKTERLNVCSFKFYADGALGSRGACLLQPYSDKLGEQGFLLNTPGYFDTTSRAVSNKFQVNTHCIGDSAVRLLLSIFNNRPLRNGRWRIEHFQVTTKEDILFLKKIAMNEEARLIPSVQPTHATSDMYWATERLGAERMEYAYAYNDLLKSAGMIALGTDFPVENINPLFTFYAAVARKDLKGFPANGFQMENALSRENTLRGMTTWGAYANFEEHEKGSIESGKFADFIMLDNDIMKCNIDLVPTTKVIFTFINGEQVYHQ
jgi:predicted amidohydrolase YtcJ